MASTDPYETPRDVVAANVRARMAWKRISRNELALRFGWSRKTAYNKLEGLTGFSDNELAAIAEILGLDDPGPLFSVPPGFAWTNVSAGQRMFLVAA